MHYYFNKYTFTHTHCTIPGDYNSGQRYLICRECNEHAKLDKNGALRQWSYDTPPADWNVWYVRDDSNAAGLFKEHAKQHKISACEECGYFMRKHNLKRHQNTMYCEAHSRAKRLREAGFERFWHRDGHKIESFFEAKQEMLTIDHSARASIPLKMFERIVNARTKVEYKLKRDIKWRMEHTRYSQGGWGRKQSIEREIWIDAKFANYFSLFVNGSAGNGGWDKGNGSYSRWVMSDDCMARLIEFAGAKKSHKEAMTCMAELAKEACNG